MSCCLRVCVHILFYLLFTCNAVVGRYSAWNWMGLKAVLGHQFYPPRKAGSHPRLSVFCTGSTVEVSKQSGAGAGAGAGDGDGDGAGAGAGAC